MQRLGVVSDALAQQPPSTNSNESKSAPVHVLTVRLPPEPTLLEAGAPDRKVETLAPRTSAYSTCDRALDRL